MNIFIKTCKKDLCWLDYCLKSINKYGTYDELVIVCDESGREDLTALETYNAKIFYVPDTDNGYINQQIVKLQAYKYTDEKRILFVDSDCVFTRQFSESDFVIDGKPFWLKTRYGNLGDGEVWKAITESYVNWPVEWEYMRRLPMMILRETLVKLAETFPILVTTLSQMKNRTFSEFNMMGAYADKHQQEDYTFINTEHYLPPTVIRQYWSWGGITEAIKLEIEKAVQ